MILSAAVSAGVITAVQAWPEVFGGEDQGDPDAFPSTGADMSGFEIEQATPASFARDIEAMVRASQQVSLPEEEAPPLPRLPGLPDTEWT